MSQSERGKSVALPAPLYKLILAIQRTDNSVILVSYSSALQFKHYHPYQLPFVHCMANILYLCLLHPANIQISYFNGVLCQP